MGSVIKIILIAVIIGICYSLPKGYNEYFLERHRSEAISWPLAVISVILLLLAIFLGCNGGWVFWVLFSAFIVFTVFTLVLCGYNAKNARASVFEIIVAIIMQLLTILGILVFVVLFIAAINSLDKKRKK